MRKYEVINADNLDEREYLTLDELRADTKDVVKKLGYMSLNPKWDGWIDNYPRKELLETAALLYEKAHCILNVGDMSERDISDRANAMWDEYGINL